MRLEDDTLLSPNDRYWLPREEFRLYYTSLSSDRQTIDVYVEDNFGQKKELHFSLMAKVQSSTWIFLNPLLLPQKLNEMRKLLFCLFFLCFPCLWLRAQQRIAFARLPPFERRCGVCEIL